MTIRHRQAPFAILFLVLLLATAVERRLAELDFNATGVVRLENGEKPDGDEIFNRLVFVDDLAAPQAPASGEVCRGDLTPSEPRPLLLVTVRLSESRAPPYQLSFSVA